MAPERWQPLELPTSAPEDSSSSTRSADGEAFQMIGKQIGPYRVVRHLGQGGMGTVFLADDIRLHRQVAIKTLRRSPDDEAYAEQVLIREARAVARLSHPNIATVYDVIEHDGRTHIVMEYLKGETLDGRLRRGVLPIADVVRISTQMLQALGHAHQQGILHCDFKPSNVFLSHGGAVKVLDFGLARLVDGETGESSAHVGASPTLIRRRAGTPAYMSPEHSMGHVLDARADLYSLAVVVHEMATGRRPPLSMAIETEQLGAVDPALPHALRPVVSKALAPDPRDRFESADEMDRELTAVVIPPASRWSKIREHWRTAALVVGLALVGAAIAISFVPGDTPERASSTARPIVAVLPFTTDGTEPTAQYVAAGLTEIVTNDLSTSKDLVVVSNASARAAAGDKPDIARSARQLGASHLVLGAVTTAGNRIRLALRVFAASNGHMTDAEVVEAGFVDLVGKDRALTTAIRGRLSEAGLPTDVSTITTTSAPTDARALEDYARGREYLEQAGEANIDRALELFVSALKRDPTFALGHAALSEASWRKYRRTRGAEWASQAQAEAFEALRLAPNEPRVRYSAAIVLHGTGRTREALDELSRVIAMQPTNDEAHRLLGRIYAESGKFDDSVAAFQAAIALRPGSWENYHAFGLACFENGRYKEAIGAFERETELRPDSASPFQALGTSYHAIGEIERALENYKRAISIAPSAFAYSNMAMIYHSQRRYREAVAAYEQSDRIAPNEPVTQRNLADSLAKAGDRIRARQAYSRSIELADQELRINPRNARLITLQAICDAKIGNHSMALRRARSAVSIAPADNEVLFQAGVVMALLGDPDQAMSFLKRAVDAGYSRSLVVEDEDLDVLRSRADFSQLVEKPK